MVSKTFQRQQNGEAIIRESDISRDQVVLVASATPYKPNTILAKFTAGANAGKWCKFDPAGADGQQVAKGYLYESRPASTGTQRCTALVRDCRLNGKKLTWDTATAISQPQIAAAIAQLAGNNTDGTGNVQVGY